MCAICILKRRRREREESARIAKGNIGSDDDGHAREINQKVWYELIDNLCFICEEMCLEIGK